MRLQSNIGESHEDPPKTARQVLAQGETYLSSPPPAARARANWLVYLPVSTAVGLGTRV